MSAPVELKSLCFSQTADGKENCGIDGINIKEVKRVKTLAEVDKTTSSKKGLAVNSLAKAQTQPSTNSRHACREGLRVLRTQSNEKASLQNPRKPHNAEKTGIKGTRSQSLQYVQPKGQPASHAPNKTQLSRKSSLVSAHRCTDQSRTKTEVQSTKPLAKTLTETSIKTTSSQKPMNTTETKMQTNSVSKTQVKPAQQPRSQSAAPKLGTHTCSSQSNKPLNQKPKPSTNGSDVNQRKNILKFDATKSKSNSSAAVRATRASASSALSKPENRESAAVSRNKQPPPSTKPSGRSTRSCVPPPELHRSAKRSSQAQPALQIQTPKSRVCPSTRGVRTAPVDGAKKPTAAQEERL